MVIIINVRVYLAILGVAAMLAGGCNKSRNIQNPEAIRKGVMEYLAKRSSVNLETMQVEVASVNFRENEADAVVSFKPKGSNDPASGMKMSYTLERKGDQWVVKGRSGKGGGSPHGEGAGMPGGMGAMGGGEMPPAHPPIPQGDSTGNKK